MSGTAGSSGAPGESSSRMSAPSSQSLAPWTTSPAGDSLALLEGKVVKFFYQGGSSPGERVVKVVRYPPRRYLLHGKDVAKDEFRNYSSSKIRSGEIFVVY